MHCTVSRVMILPGLSRWIFGSTRPWKHQKATGFPEQKPSTCNRVHMILDIPWHKKLAHHGCAFVTWLALWKPFMVGICLAYCSMEKSSGKTNAFWKKLPRQTSGNSCYATPSSNNQRRCKKKSIETNQPWISVAAPWAMGHGVSGLVEMAKATGRGGETWQGGQPQKLLERSVDIQKMLWRRILAGWLPRAMFFLGRHGYFFGLGRLGTLTWGF